MAKAVTAAGVVGVWLVCLSITHAAEIVQPNLGGTLVDGGVFGPFDGIADGADWSFDQSSYEGSIALATETPGAGLEHRTVWEYDLSVVTAELPVSATLAFTLRGVSVFPFPDVDIHVYAYPADLLNTPDDFSAGPAILQGSVTVVAFQGATAYILDVTDVVTDALVSGDDRVALRFQIASDTPHTANQAFGDALDSDPATKPCITVAEALPGDATGDGEVDLDDYAIFADCLAGPDAPVAPTQQGVTTETCLRVFDSDADEDVDLHDFRSVQEVFAGE